MKFLKSRGFKRFLLIFLFAAILTSLYLFNHFLNKEKLWIYSTGTDIKAFLNTTWEMSPQEVKRVSKIQSYLANIVKGKYPRLLDNKRFRKLSQKSVNLFGSTAAVEYHFFDDRLFAYEIYYRNVLNLDTLEMRIFKALSEKYGKSKEVNLPKKKYKYSLDRFLDEMDNAKEFFWNTSTILVVLEHRNIWDRSKGKHIGSSISISVQYKPELDRIKMIHEKENNEVF